MASSSNFGNDDKKYIAYKFRERWHVTKKGNKNTIVNTMKPSEIHWLCVIDCPGGKVTAGGYILLQACTGI